MVWPQGAAVALLSMDLAATLVTQVTIYRVIVAFPTNAFAPTAMHLTEQAWDGLGWPGKYGEHHGLFDLFHWLQKLRKFQTVVNGTNLLARLQS